MPDEVEILIIGAGPAGLSVAAECLYHEIGSVKILEKGETHNQTVYQYYPDEKRVDATYKGQEALCAGILCFRDTTKANFLSIVNEMIRLYSIPIFYQTFVDSLRRTEKGFQVSNSDGKTYRSRFVVIAIGRMGKPNKPDYFANIPAMVRSRIQFDVRNINPVNTRLLVVGGGNSAVEFALSLSGKGLVTLSYRKEVFSRLNPMNLDLLNQDEKRGTLRILRNSHISYISEADGKPQVHFNQGGSEVFDTVIFGIGGSSPQGFLQNSGVNLDAKGNPVLSSSLETNIPGLYVAGELSVPPGKGSIIASFNSGKTIAESIAKKLSIQRKPELVGMEGAPSSKL